MESHSAALDGWFSSGIVQEIAQYSLSDEGIHVGKLGQGRKITIPRSICDNLGLHEGEFIGFKVRSDGLSVLPQNVLETILHRMRSRGTVDGDKS